MLPLVSVVMPVYNAEKYIDNAINSILNQTYKNIELILVEDSSTDNTKKLLKKYNDFRVKIFFNKENMGIAYSTNRAISQAKGEYIALMDDDDIAEKERLSLQVKYMEAHDEIDILGGRTIFIDERGQVIDYSVIPRNNPKYIKAMLLFNCLDFMNGTAIIRREFILRNNLKFEDNCYGMQDFKFYIESSKIGNISSIPNFLLKHRIHDNNETKRNFEKFQQERANKYIEFQNYSLQKSGFCLKERELQLINKVMAEMNGGCNTKKDLYDLYKIYAKIIQQGMDMKIDYIKELEHLLKLRLSEQIRTVEHFFENESII